MHITFIQPAIGRKRDGSSYPKTWIMEPLSVAMLSSLTPPTWQRAFFDDRLGEVDTSIMTDLVCISTECYTARRAYQIADAFRKRGVKVAMGGMHATLMPDEVAQHADAVCIGEAENYWLGFLNDAQCGTLKPRYASDSPVDPAGRFCDRSIFGNRNYGPLALLETSRGCRFTCEFCSITKFFRQTYTPRPVADVVREAASINKKFLFFVDDNLAMDIGRLKELCRALAPLRKTWIAQLSIHTAHDDELLRLMRDSGCAGVLIGFESLNSDTLQHMGKRVNSNTDFSCAIERLRAYGISIYATFVFGYDDDDEQTFATTLAFAREHRFFFTAFNHLVPFPGTDVYARLQREGRLLSERWWLEPSFTFGDVVFTPRHFSATRLTDLCQQYRKKFYSLPSIFARGMDLRANASSLTKMFWFFATNFSLQREIFRRRNLPLGVDT